MKHTVVAGLAWLVGILDAHPTAASAESSLKTSALDAAKYRMPTLSEYADNNEVVADSSIMSLMAGSYIDTATAVVKNIAPEATFRLVDDHYVGESGIGHVRFRQTHHGIDIDNADINVNIAKDGSVLSYGNSFYNGKLPGESPFAKRQFSDPKVALASVIKKLDLPIQAGNAKVEAISGNVPERFAFKQTTGTFTTPEARLVYFATSKDSMFLTWRIETDIGDHWLLSYLDAANNDKIHGVVDYTSDLSASFEVYPWGVNDPTRGNRTVLKDPWLNDKDASPFNWFGDGSTEYTTTRGNNAIAHTNPSGKDEYINNYRPTSQSRTFEYKYSPTQSNKNDYRDASVTQLFYSGNKVHDILYQLGFTEKAGNFQFNNNGKGGKDKDFVVLNAQDGYSTNNAYFSTPPDGQPGRMKMLMWTSTNPNRDCSFATDVVLHEYGHGLSNRLTGGPSNSGCLNGLESGGMGEGWSDYLAIFNALKSTDKRTTNKVIGDWVTGKSGGIRQYPYSTSMQTNPLTYKAVDKSNGVHQAGTVWCSALYEVLWNLIDKHGIKDNEYPEYDDKGVPTDGRFLAAKLVIDGMALQPCNPTMVSARKAIIDADKNLTGGKNACDLWKAFAKRGLGEKAAYDSKSRKEDFTVPSGVC